MSLDKAWLINRLGGGVDEDEEDEDEDEDEGVSRQLGPLTIDAIRR